MGKYLDKQGVETLWNKTKALNGQKQDRTSAELDTEAKEIVPAINEAAAAAKSAQERADVSAKTDGYYAAMRVGTADNLTARGDATTETFTRRTAGGDNAIEEGNATIKAIKGNSVVVNNYMRLTDNKYAVYGTTTIQDDMLQFQLTSTGGPYSLPRIGFTDVTFSSAAKYLFAFRIRAPYESSSGYIGGNNSDMAQITRVPYNVVGGQWNSVAGVISVSTTASNYDLRINFPINSQSSAAGDIYYIKDIQRINLTQMFGSGNEPATPEEFAARLGYASVADIPYIPYNKGTIVDMTATGMRTAGTDDDGLAWTQERNWKPVIDKYFGGHLRSAGNVRDEITANTAMKRIGFVEDLGELNWGSNSETWPTDSLYSFNIAKEAKDNGAAFFSSGVTRYSLKSTRYGVALSIIVTDKVNSAAEANAALKGVAMNYELSISEEYDIDGQNLTIKVAPGGTEEIIAPEGGDVIASAPVVADMVYPIDSYKTIKDNKAHIGSMASLATAAKSDLVAAINELTGRVAALETKATAETSTTEEEQ